MYFIIHSVCVSWHPCYNKTKDGYCIPAYSGQFKTFVFFIDVRQWNTGSNIQLWTWEHTYKANFAIFLSPKADMSLIFDLDWNTKYMYWLLKHTFYIQWCKFHPNQSLISRTYRGLFSDRKKNILKKYLPYILYNIVTGDHETPSKITNVTTGDWTWNTS
jgi:hypothetical protein